MLDNTSAETAVTKADFKAWIEEYLDELKDIRSWDTIKFSATEIYRHLEPLAEAEQRLFLLSVLDWLDGGGADSKLVSAIKGVFSGSRVQSHKTGERLMEALLGFLLRRSLPLAEEDLHRAYRYTLKNAQHRYRDMPFGALVSHSERLMAAGVESEALKEDMLALNKHLSSGRYGTEQRKNALRLQALLGLRDTFTVDEDEPWAAELMAFLGRQPAELRKQYEAWLEHCCSATASKPGKAWSKRAAELFAVLPQDELVEQFAVILSLLPEARQGEPKDEWWGESVWPYMLDDENADLLKGVLWSLGSLKHERVPKLLHAVALAAYKKLPGYGPRCAKVGNAAVLALSAIGLSGVNQLALIRLRTSHKSVLKTIDKALAQAAKNAGMSMAQLEDMSVPSYGLQSPGFGEFEVGDYVARVQCEAGNKVSLVWVKGDGKLQKTVPKVVKEECADDLKELKAAVKELQAMLPAQKTRIESSYLKQRRWGRDDFISYYLDHPLMGFLARRLIWQIEQGGETITVMWHEDALRDVNGTAVELDDDVCVSLWHPLMGVTDTTLAWRERLELLQISQPFKQAHREVYVLTDAEINTDSYSNRFAAHVLKQHQFNALAGHRGWSYTLQGAWDGGDSIARIDVPGWNLSAEFWVDGIGEYGNDTSGSGVFLYVTTDQVRFYPLPEELGGNPGVRYGADPMDVRDVPELAFSEILRDVDLFVGVASVGNDPEWEDGGPEGRYRDYWQSYSFGDLNASAKMRKEQLQRLVPRLKIAPVAEVTDKFLVIKGKLRIYKIHLGSANILMEPNDQYLCIVPGRSKAGDNDKVFLPFEGDSVLSIILSKALLLAADDKIKDQTIVSQIQRR